MNDSKLRLCASLTILGAIALACQPEELPGAIYAEDVLVPRGDTERSAPADVGPEYIACDPTELLLGEVLATGDCSSVVDGGLANARSVEIRPDCTDLDITALADKRHLAIVPEAMTQEVLWLHLGGSGGRPAATANIGHAAAREGYRYISLAYPNERSVAARCNGPTGPRPDTCAGDVRLEVLYGVERTHDFEMQADEAIVPRLLALLQFLNDEQPGEEWLRYVAADGQPAWDRIAVSGFGQGGGMAGLIARDHRVARALYLSNGAGGTLTRPADAEACFSHASCASGRCCVG